MKILFFTLYTEQGASSRYRVYQFLPWLERAGIGSRVLPFYTSTHEALARRLRAIAWLRKTWDHGYLWWGWARRLVQILGARRYDAVFIQKELLPRPLFALLRRLNPRIIYDFDDALYLSDEEQRRWIGWVTLHRGDVRLPRILRGCRHVLVANEHARRYALQFCPSVTKLIMPIDTERFRPTNRPRAAEGAITIGWIGQERNVQYLTALKETLEQLCEKFPRVRLKVVGVPRYRLNGLPLEAKPWRFEEEVDDLATFDIGLMPLSDDPWASGKGGCKLIQYMAMGIPSVASAVGVNGELLRHGHNGLTASTTQEWSQALEQLIRNPDLRECLGRAGRQTIEDLCALSRRAPEWVDIVKGVASSTTTRVKTHG